MSRATPKKSSYSKMEMDIIRELLIELRDLKQELTAATLDVRMTEVDNRRKSERLAALEREKLEWDARLQELETANLSHETLIEALKTEIVMLKSRISFLEMKVRNSRPKQICSECAETGHNVRTCRFR